MARKRKKVDPLLHYHGEWPCTQPGCMNGMTPSAQAAADALLAELAESRKRRLDQIETIARRKLNKEQRERDRRRKYAR